MRYYRSPADDGVRLVAIDDDGGAYDLTSARAGLRSFADLARATVEYGDGPTDGDASTDEARSGDGAGSGDGRADGVDVDAVARPLLKSAEPVDPVTVPESALVPVVADEVWAAGVTYEVSDEAREAESGRPDVYEEVYGSERPEVFFKATPSRTVGPGEAVGVRGDSDWDVPEPELGVVLHRGEVVGYTVGDDVSSRDIEGENPLYLPQAKVYDRCCALGPCVASPETIGDPHDLAIEMTVRREDDVAFRGEASTAEMVRTCEELASYVTRHNVLPEVAVVLTGTSIVPPESFTLREGDRVAIDVEEIGSLENPVTTV